jgi:hypothetical protein
MSALPQIRGNVQQSQRGNNYMYISEFQLDGQFSGTTANAIADLDRSSLENLAEFSTGKILTGSFENTDGNLPVANPVLVAVNGSIIFPYQGN